MKIAVIDDEKRWQEKILYYLKQNYRQEHEISVSTFTSAKEFMNRNNLYDIVFMDVELNEQDGLEAGQLYKSLFPESILIIVTTHKEWCNRGYQAQAFRYLDKSNLEIEMREAICSVKEKLVQQKILTFHVVLIGDVKVRVQDILYFETSSLKRNIILHTKDREYNCTGKISDYEEHMLKNGFFLTHRSYLVNFAWIKEFTKTKVILKNEEHIDLSIRKYSEFKKNYFEWKIKIGNG